LDQRFQAIDQRFDKMDQRFDILEHRFEVLSERGAGLEEHASTRDDINRLYDLIDGSSNASMWMTPSGLP